MRKLIVSNFVTLGGLYEGKGKDIQSLLTIFIKITTMIRVSISITQNRCG